MASGALCCVGDWPETCPEKFVVGQSVKVDIWAQGMPAMIAPLYLALTPAEHGRLHAQGVISPSLFDSAPSNKFFWLFRDTNDAIEFASQMHTKNALLAATETTLWYLVQVTFTVEQ